MSMSLNLGLGIQGRTSYTLPDGTEPLIVLDFKSGIYMANDAATTLAALVAEDDTYGQWDEAWVTPGVGIQHPASMTLTGDALALVLAGATAIYTVDIVTADSDATMQVEMVDWPDFNTYYFAKLGSLGAVIQIGDNVAPNLHDYGDGITGLPTGVHKAATTMIDGKIARSIDGLAVSSIDPAAPWTVAPNFLGISTGSANIVLEKIALYPAQDDAELPALSALS